MVLLKQTHLPENMSREHYTAKTVASAAHLLESCADAGQIDTIMARMTEMLNNVWDFEYRKLKRENAPVALPVMCRVFWDKVAYELVCTVDKLVYSFMAVYGEEVNPPGQEGNVHISFRANGCVSFFVTQLKLKP